MLGALLLASSSSLAQIGQPAAPPPGTVANQLPVSGRTAQTGSVTTVQSPVAGTTTSVSTLNTSVEVSGSFAGSASSTAKAPFSGKLSFREAIQRGLDYNLGSIEMAQVLRESQGQTRVARSSLLPNLNASLSETAQQINLAIAGIRFQSPLPGFSIPTIVGPYNYFDLRARLIPTLLVWMLFGAVAVPILSDTLDWRIVVYAAISLTAIRMVPVAAVLHLETDVVAEIAHGGDAPGASPSRSG